MAAPVRFADVGFEYAGRPPVLRHLNLDVEAAEVLVLVGRSGAGKTTLLKLINRLLLPTKCNQRQLRNNQKISSG